MKFIIHPKPRNKPRALRFLFVLFSAFVFLQLSWTHVLIDEHSPISNIITFSKWKDSDKTWTPKNEWDEPPKHFYADSDTGSFQKCTKHLESPRHSYTLPNSDESFITISCHRISFRAPIQIIQEQKNDIIIGVLSAASGTGPMRRNYIRSTWAKELQNGVFFIVAGSWQSIEREFMLHQDMIWIDEEEVYKGERSVLTYKTISFFSIVHHFAPPIDQGGFKHAIKTDDDSYVNVKKFERFLSSNMRGKEFHYFGQCPQFQVKPSRDIKNKWPVTYKTYPEPSFPLYCQGAGFGLSRELLSCAVDQGHVQNFRYVPFEDVSVGMLAERCGYKPTMIPGIRVFRADIPKERKCVNEAIPMVECFKGDDSWPPDANMSNNLIQHRVESKDDMVNIHQSLGLKVQWVDAVTS